MSGRSRIDLAGVLGVPIGVGCILVGQLLEGGSVHSILQLTAAIIVFGGTLGATMIGFTIAELKQACRGIVEVFVDRQEPVEATIDMFKRLATLRLRLGIMAIEDEVTALEDPFMRRGLGLAVDGANPALVRETLEAECRGRDEVEEVPAKVFEAAGGYAPTIGIIGAVLGLIHVMENLSDPTKLGSGIAVAFVATVYGVGSANLMFLPVASKLRSRAARSAVRREVMLEGIISIQEGQNPRLLEEKLRALVASPSPTPTRRATDRAA